MITAFIPVRGGSKSIPGKNIKSLCGKPLIWWNLVQLEATEEVDEVVVATDDLKIKEVVLSFDFKKVRVYDRDPANAQDTSSTESVMLEFLEKSSYKSDDLFILVQATSPFTKKHDFEKAIKKFKSEKADSLVTCTRIKRFIWDESGKPLNYDYNKRPRRQEFKGLLVENGAFYITSVENLKKFKNRLNGKTAVYEIEDERSFFEIDDEQDWKVTEVLLGSTH